MSVGNRAARGAMWNVGASTGTRVLGLTGTLFVTGLLNPDVIGNIVQSTITTALIFRATGVGWFRPTPWRWQRVREIVRFGGPLGLAQLFDFGTRYWDNLAFGKFFGQTQVGLYNMAYNLADIPAVQVGEQISSVLLPAMASLEVADRKAALIRSTALMSLVVFPLAVGLGVIAPTLIAAMLNEKWQGVAPLLVVLSVLSVVRPMGWGVSCGGLRCWHVRAHAIGGARPASGPAPSA